MKFKYLLLLPMLASSTAFAQAPANPPKPPMSGPMSPMDGMKGPRGEHHKNHLACAIKSGEIKDVAVKLHDSLKLKPDQESAWTTFENATLVNIAPLGQECGVKPDHKLPLPDKLGLMAKQTKTMSDVLLTEQKLVVDFYAVLTPDQKASFEKFKPHRHHERFEH
jgi:hypothetical protein